MTSDVALVAGLILAFLSAPAGVAALSGARSWLLFLGLAVLGAGLVAYAVTTNPDAYTLRDIPDAVLRVIARVIR